MSFFFTEYKWLEHEMEANSVAAKWYPLCMNLVVMSNCEQSGVGFILVDHISWDYSVWSQKRRFGLHLWLYSSRWNLEVPFILYFVSCVCYLHLMPLSWCMWCLDSKRFFYIFFCCEVWLSTMIVFRSPLSTCYSTWFSFTSFLHCIISSVASCGS